MTIGKRKGATAKGAGDSSGNSDRFGGSLSKNDHWYIQQAFGQNADPGSAAPSGGMEATGGVIMDWTDPSPGKNYRTHVFGATGTFSVDTLSTNPTIPNALDWTIIAAGGGGGRGANAYGGGGGAGGYRSSMPEGPGGPSPTAEGPITAEVRDYTITIGAGGVGAGPQGNGAGTNGNDGGDSSISSPGSPSFTTLTSGGGGGGGSTPNPTQPGGPYAGTPGGSGGGSGQSPNAAASGNSGQGYAGGSSTTTASAAGGGGAGGVGGDQGPTGISGGGVGGDGKRALILGPTYGGVGKNGPGGDWGYFAGGGGGGGSDMYAAGGSGGGGRGSNYPGPWGHHAFAMTGSGGGGGASPGNDSQTGGNGAGGIVMVRYEIKELGEDSSSDTPAFKCTGGLVKTVGSNTVHVFKTPGTFTNRTDSPVTCHFVAVAGGGGAADDMGGGGGAGGVVCSESGLMPVQSPQITCGPDTPNAWTITVGAGGHACGKYATSPGSPPEPNGDPAGYGGNSIISGPGPVSVIAAGGGGGSATNSPGPYVGLSGGSGGGGRANRSPNDGGEGNIYPPASPSPGGAAPGQGNDGSGGNGGGIPSGSYLSGGGGGAGSAGAPGDNPGNGYGGSGVQLPTAYRSGDLLNLVGAPGPGPGSSSPNPGQFWVAGGGGAGGDASALLNPGPNGAGSGGGTGGGPGAPRWGWAGAQPGSASPNKLILNSFQNETPLWNDHDGQQGTGAGGAGAGAQITDKTLGGKGGSGIVLIYYTS